MQSKARSQGTALPLSQEAGPGASARAPQTGCDSQDLISVIYFPSRAGGCGSSLRKVWAAVSMCLSWGKLGRSRCPRSNF